MCLPGVNGATNGLRGIHQDHPPQHNRHSVESGRPGLRQRQGLNMSANNALDQLKRELKTEERLPRGLECLVRCFNGNFRRRKKGGPRRRLDTSEASDRGEQVLEFVAIRS